jgi:hypothetical protein
MEPHIRLHMVNAKVDKLLIANGRPTSGFYPNAECDNRRQSPGHLPRAGRAARSALATNHVRCSAWQCHLSKSRGSAVACLTWGCLGNVLSSWSAAPNCCVWQLQKQEEAASQEQEAAGC